VLQVVLTHWVHFVVQIFLSTKSGLPFAKWRKYKWVPRAGIDSGDLGGFTSFESA